MATRNYVPRANGEGGIGTKKKHWGGAFFDKLAVKTLEVIDGGTENDAQPATVGWVNQRTSKLSQVSILTGILAHGQTIPLPEGYEEGQCKWTVSVAEDNHNHKLWATRSEGLSYGVDCYANNRRVYCLAYLRSGNSVVESKEGAVNYIIIGVK